MREEYKTIMDFTDYKVNEFGDVYSFKFDKFKKLKPWINRYGYLNVTLSENNKRKHKTVHSLVLATFKRLRKENEQCNHIDGNKLNNCLDNLEWVTLQENIIHAKENDLLSGTIFKDGELHINSKLNEKDIYFIRELYADGNFFQKDIAEMVGCTRSNIKAIVNRQTWTHI